MEDGDGVCGALQGVLDVKTLEEVLRKASLASASAAAASTCEAAAAKRRLPPLQGAAAELRRLLLERLGHGSESAAEDSEDDAEALHVEVSLRDAEAAGDDQLSTGAAYVKLNARQPAQTARMACSRCRRPLTVQICDAGHSEAGREALQQPAVGSSPPKTGRGYCVASVLADAGQDSFLKALLLGQSIITAGSDVDRVLLHGDDVPRPYLDVLERVWQLQRLRSAWCPRLPGRRRFGSASAAMLLHVLQLTDYTKVLLCELGLVMLKPAEPLFQLECPAAVLRRLPSKLAGGLSSAEHPSPALILLEPSADMLKRLSAEIGTDDRVLSSTHLQWPPRGRDADRASSGYSPFDDYLGRFYRSFSAGSWQAVPSELAPTPLKDRRKLLDAAVESQSLLVQSQGWWRALESQLAALHAGDSGERDAVLPCVHDLSELLPSVLEALGAVRSANCCKCGTYEDIRCCTDGADDAGVCLCRFCSAVYENQAQEQLNELTTDEAAALRSDLGPFFLGNHQRQRWAVVVEPLGRIEVEFRPNGVLLLRDIGVGAWVRPSGGHTERFRIALHLPGGGGIDSVEMRYTFDLKVDKNARDGAGSKELSEVRREVLKPLGFASLPRPDRWARGWPLGMRSFCSWDFGWHEACGDLRQETESAPAAPLAKINAAPAGDEAAAAAVVLDSPSSELARSVQAAGAGAAKTDARELLAYLIKK
eukprot:TRINITY_DN100640_c0_g1_i1.p1 TRINITY_DN100640_c0_g1~~TRINITY_DN100640_c0_g1_i1.p1  ORF type:complete len:708 (-),score=168.12 TRINITY_DN100640_c0_g1_i1:110-2233(-)